jgi:antitoxin CcdA
MRMSSRIAKSSGRKRPTNVSISADLLRHAKTLKINLSQALEQRLAELVGEARKQRWLEDNREALDDYNRRIEKGGVFSGDLRRF